MNSEILMIVGVVAIIAFSRGIAKHKENTKFKADYTTTTLDTIEDAPVALVINVCGLQLKQMILKK